MSVYIFTLTVGFIFGGVDFAQGYRAKVLKDFPEPVKYIFTEPSTGHDMARYEKVGIDRKQMLGMHQYFTDHRTLEVIGKTEDKLKELKESLQYTETERRQNEIRLLRNGAVLAAILLDEEDNRFYYGIHYYKQMKLLRTEIYTEGLSYVNNYVTARTENGLYAKLVRRTFYNRDGTAAYDQIFEKEKEWYLFPDGKRYTKQQFLLAFLERLNLKERDIVLLDHPQRSELLQPIFQFGKRARLMVAVHSEHFHEKGESPYELYLSREYNYCFKYSAQIDTLIVSTEEQKRGLIEKLQEYRCSVPQIAVIPAGGIEQLRYPAEKRMPYSMVSASRIERRKKIDWIIQSTIKAHRVNPNISLDIYGPNDDVYGYLSDIQNLILENQAQTYIRLMGWADMTEIYKNYEVYISASIKETFGMSLMEATASGTAMIGLDVKYGNRLFIKPGVNGCLVDYHIHNENDEKMTDAIAEKIIEIFVDEERLEKFHRNSYEIAKDFGLKSMIQKWKDILM